MLKLIKNMRRKEKEMALLCLVFVVVQIYFDLRLPDYMTELTMLIKTSGTTADIAAVGLKMLGCTAASAVLAIACGFLAAKTASGFSFAVREKLFRHVMDIGSEEMQDFSIPSLITRTTNDITQIQMIIAMGLQMMIKAPIMAVWAIIKILGKSWELSAVTAAFVVVLFTTVLLIMGSCIPRFRLVQKMTDKINRVARENLTGINVVHAFNAEEFQNEKFDGPSRGMMDLQMKNQKLFALVQPSMSLGMNGLALAIYWVGAALVNSIAVTDMAARLTMFSEVLVFSTYATYIVMSFMMLAMIFMLLPQAQVSAERINEVLDETVDITDGPSDAVVEDGSVDFEDVCFSYSGDPDKLARVFDNILRNAIAYCYENTKIEIQARMKNNKIEITFTNSGDRIPGDMLQTIFEKFYRLDDSRSTETGGAGLGLAIAREIVELHGGRIIAKSDDNKTQFIVTLPSKSKQEEGDSDEVHTHSGRASRRKSGRRKKVQRKKKK